MAATSMGSFNRAEMDDKIKAAHALGEVSDAEVEVQTDKERVKLIGCRECERPLIVTTFFAPAKGICLACKGEDGSARGRPAVASVGQPVPGQTDPAIAVNLADCLVNEGFKHALCPAHPNDPDHEMELKAVAHAPNYGPQEIYRNAKGELVVRQTAIGESVTHQCLACKATVSYSTTPQTQLRRQNEPKIKDRPGAQTLAGLFGVRDEEEPVPA